MDHKEVGLLLSGLIVVQGAIAIFLSYGLNGKYFKETPHLAEALLNLRKNKPRTAMVIGILYSLCLVDVLIAMFYSIGRH